MHGQLGLQATTVEIVGAATCNLVTASSYNSHDTWEFLTYCALVVPVRHVGLVAMQDCRCGHHFCNAWTQVQ